MRIKGVMVMLMAAALPLISGCSHPAPRNAERYVGRGVDVTVVQSLDRNMGASGNITVAVTVNAPAGVKDVSVFQSGQVGSFPWTTRFSEVGRQGDTWTFMLFADQVDHNLPFHVGLYEKGLSGNSRPQATITFKWPPNFFS